MKLNRVNELEEAELRLQMRQLYRDAGLPGSLQALYEILLAAAILSEVIHEERQTEREEKAGSQSSEVDE